jgi:hypothetical protein
MPKCLSARDKGTIRGSDMKAFEGSTRIKIRRNLLARNLCYIDKGDAFTTAAPTIQPNLSVAERASAVKEHGRAG